jgi:hypothetical protein
MLSAITRLMSRTSTLETVALLGVTISEFVEIIVGDVLNRTSSAPSRIER